MKSSTSGAVSIVRTATGAEEDEARAALKKCGYACKPAIVSHPPGPDAGGSPPRPWSARTAASPRYCAMRARPPEGREERPWTYWASLCAKPARLGDWPDERHQRRRGGRGPVPHPWQRNGYPGWSSWLCMPAVPGAGTGAAAGAGRGAKRAAPRELLWMGVLLGRLFAVACGEVCRAAGHSP